eukprot:g22451.t1
MFYTDLKMSVQILRSTFGTIKVSSRPTLMAIATQPLLRSMCTLAGQSQKRTTRFKSALIAKCTCSSFLTSAPPNSSISVHLLVKFKNETLSGATTRAKDAAHPTEARACFGKDGFEPLVFQGNFQWKNLWLERARQVARTRPLTLIEYHSLVKAGFEPLPLRYNEFRTTTVTRHRGVTGVARPCVRRKETLDKSSSNTLLEKGSAKPIAPRRRNRHEPESKLGHSIDHCADSLQVTPMSRRSKRQRCTDGSYLEQHVLSDTSTQDSVFSSCSKNDSHGRNETEADVDMSHILDNAKGERDATTWDATEVVEGRSDAPGLSMSEALHDLEAFVTETCGRRASASHSDQHMRAVYASATTIYKKLYPSDAACVRPLYLLVATVAWLHDVCDHKYILKEPSIRAILQSFLLKFTSKYDHLVQDTAYSALFTPAKLQAMCDRISFSREKEQKATDWLETLGPQGVLVRDIVSDADKWEAIGTKGIERCKEYTIERAKEEGLDPTPAYVAQRVRQHYNEKLKLLSTQYMRTEPGRVNARQLDTEMLTALAKLEAEATRHARVASDTNTTSVGSQLGELSVSRIRVSLPVILGSASAARKHLLTQAGVRFTVITADLDERALTVPGSALPRERSDAAELSAVVANAKADRILSVLPEDAPESLLVTADAMAHFEGVIREKPSSIEELRKWWAQYQVSPVCACTTVVVCNTKTRRRFQGNATCQQIYKRMPESVLEQLIANGVLIGCAGGYIVDDPLVWPYLGERSGSQSCLMGFPIEVCKSLLEEASLATRYGCSEDLTIDEKPVQDGAKNPLQVS